MKSWGVPCPLLGKRLFFLSIQLKWLLFSASIYLSRVTILVEVCTSLKHTSLCCPVNVLSPPAFPSRHLQSLQIVSHLMTLPFAIYSVFSSYKVIIHVQRRKHRILPSGVNCHNGLVWRFIFAVFSMMRKRRLEMKLYENEKTLQGKRQDTRRYF